LQSVTLTLTCEVWPFLWRAPCRHHYHHPQATSQQAHADQQLLGMLDQHAGGNSLPSVHGDGLSLVMPTALEPLIALQNGNAELDGQLSPVVALHNFSGDMSHPAQPLMPSSQVRSASMHHSASSHLLALHARMCTIESDTACP
jgi:hypothetical protein